MKGNRRPSVMEHKFSQVPRAEIPRSTFDRSHGYKTTFDAGWLIPIFVDEALPGDTFSLNMTGFARLATPIFPIMDNMYMETQFFSVPIRLLWSNWQKMNGEQTDPGDSTDFTVPQCVSPVGGYTEGSLYDYLGLPVGVASLSHSAFWTRAHNLIYNTWYRDQNLQDSVVVDTDNGPDDPADYVLLRRGKRHDYFTSALPWPQKGDAIEIPLGTSADVVFPTASGAMYSDGHVYGPTDRGLLNIETSTGTAAHEPGDLYAASLSTSAETALIRTVVTWPTDGYADLSSATAATINTLRQAFQIQKILERDARGGTRYTEIVRAHFGVTSPDARLQRPEYLGGGSTPVIVSPIPQTSATDAAVTPQGNLAAMATATLNGHGFSASFTEHCVLIGFVSVRADLTYQQGMDRMWSRSTRFDFYWPALSHIGEQAILNKELYCDGSANDDLVFGYQERYAEYRYKPSKITGAFRSSAAAPLDAWHLSQEFGSLPTLGATFIVENPPVDRVIAVDTEPHFLFDSYFRMHCARPMPVYGVPGMMDHF